MDTKEARGAIKIMQKTGRNWTKLPSGKVATMKDCIQVINRNDAESTESFIEQARRDT